MSRVWQIVIFQGIIEKSYYIPFTNKSNHFNVMKVVFFLTENQHFKPSACNPYIKE